MCAAVCRRRQKRQELTDPPINVGRQGEKCGAPCRRHGPLAPETLPAAGPIWQRQGSRSDHGRARGRTAKVFQALATRDNVVIQHATPKIQANAAKESGSRQQRTKKMIVSVPSVRPPR